MILSASINEIQDETLAIPWTSMVEIAAKASADRLARQYKRYQQAFAHKSDAPSGMLSMSDFVQAVEMLMDEHAKMLCGVGDEAKVDELEMRLLRIRHIPTEELPCGA